jgi:hypothetical protein
MIFYTGVKLLEEENEMRCRLVRFFLVAGMLFFIPFFAWPAPPAADFVIHWEVPQRIAVGENDHLELLHFPGAVYADSFPAIPLFSHSLPDELPFYRHVFSVRNAVYAPLTSEELSVLKASGFGPTKIHLQQSTQETRKQRHSALSFYPFRSNPLSGQYEKLLSFTLDSELVFEGSDKQKSGTVFATSSVLSSGDWYKLCTDNTGVYRLTYSDLQSLGLPLQGLQKRSIRLYGNKAGMLPENNADIPHDDLTELAIYVSGGDDGVFGQNDYILFYGQSPHQWVFDATSGLFQHEVHLYSQEHCYFLTTSPGTGKRIASQASSTAAATHTVNTFRDHMYHQEDRMNLIGSGRVWYGEVFDATLSRVFSFDIPDIDSSSDANIKTYLAARSSTSSSFTIRSGAHQFSAFIPAVNYADYNGFYARDAVDNFSFKPAATSPLSVEITYNRPAIGSRGWLNYIAINIDRHLRFTGSQMAFRNVDVTGAGHVAGYVIGNAGTQLRVWEVSNPSLVKQQQLSVSGNNAQFRLSANTLREFIAFDGSSYLRPRLQGRIENQNLHTMQPSDLLIVCAEEFLPEAERLAAFRSENDGLSVQIVTPAQIYNEFSTGSPDISAIRNFMKMLYDRAEHPSQLPRYLLLFGNGTIDNKNLLGFGGNLIPTYQSLASLAPNNSYMTDDYFGLLSDGEGAGAEGLLDMGIGRLPVRSINEAAAVVDKIIRYDKRVPGMEPWADNMQHVGQISNFADWRNMVVFIADDEDNNTHFIHAETLTGLVRDNHSAFNVSKIYLDAYQQTTMAGGSRYPDVNQAINNRVNKGALLINYIGHGGTQGLAHERILTFDDINTWKNYYNMPVFMTATCEFSSFDQPDPSELSAGVRIFLKPDGGAIALYTTTRLAWSGTNLTLNYNFMRNAVRRQEDGQYPRLGDLIRIAKVESAGNVQPWRIKNFVLLGDPSMQMAYPEYQVVTDMMPDTLRAFQEVQVSGYVADSQGNKVHDYNGIIYPTVFDKKNTYSTLGQDPGSFPANFNMRDALLYKGKASVENGSFSFSFKVPRDIAYAFGNGKISYYIDDGTTDGHGCYMDFTVGGTLQDYETDNTGPRINLFMNDTTFVSGGLTDENPILLAFIDDESGINITGRIGHDIVAFLNNDRFNPIVLNNYYEGNVDTYKSGRVVYPFFNLPEGLHKLQLRVWDIHNNPSEADIDFIVSSSARLALESLMNYPNPFSDATWFRFVHNQAFSELEVRIDIFDLQGRLVKTIHDQIYAGGFQSSPIYWDGKADGGQAIGNGMYVYRVRVTAPDGQRSYDTSKLVIIRSN